ncbi:MAG: hypothetical protein JRD89_19655 [Deltaproteobacteria bacterium]|nr:hypothetical protein [Deltaproteobacteria bacterium]
MRLRKTEFKFSTVNNQHEIVMWNETGFETDSETCYTVASFKRTSEGYDMVTVGDRFFKTEDNFLVAKHAIRFLQELFDITNNDDGNIDPKLGTSRSYANGHR